MTSPISVPQALTILLAVLATFVSPVALAEDTKGPIQTAIDAIDFRGELLGYVFARDLRNDSRINFGNRFDISDRELTGEVRLDLQVEHGRALLGIKPRFRATEQSWNSGRLTVRVNLARRGSYMNGSPDIVSMIGCLPPTEGRTSSGDRRFSYRRRILSFWIMGKTIPFLRFLGLTTRG